MISKKVFITPSVFFAFVDRNSPKHNQADAFFRYFAQENFHLYTTTFSIIRTYDQIKKHISYSLAKDFLRVIFVGNIEIVYPDEAITKAAIKFVLGSTSFDLNMEQALTNVVADRMQIPQICSFEYSQFYFGINLFTLPY